MPLTVTVHSIGNASGTVTSDPAGLVCSTSQSDPCTASFATGTSVTLRVMPQAGAAFLDGDCGGTPCTLVLSQPRSVTVSFAAANFVFVTSQTYTPGSLKAAKPGSSDPIMAADGLCNDAAQSAGLPGQYLAWISTSTVNAKSRFDALAITPRGWIRPDGRPFADTLSSLAADQIYYPPQITEHGDDVTLGSNAAVITGTNSSGQVQMNATCGDWTDQAQSYFPGLANSSGSEWTSGGGGQAPCSSLARLYCFGIDLYQPVTIPKASGARIAFLSKTLFQPGGPITPDALCQQDAAGLPGTYRALISTSQNAAVDIFDLNGPPWARLDGVYWVKKAVNLSSTRKLATLDVMPTVPVMHAGDSQAWTGSTDVTSKGSLINTCGDWTDTTSLMGFAGSISFTDESFFYNGDSYSCSQSLRLYCLQE